MPNLLNLNGLQIKSLNDIIKDITDGMKLIYGSDINVDSNTPDGQMINLYSEPVADMLSLLQDVYTSFNPDQATGAVLDQRVAINGITRKLGTYTIVPIEVHVDIALTLQGLDGELENPNGTGYTIRDDSGQQYICAKTTIFTGAQTKTIEFRSKEIGHNVPTQNTIQTPVNVVLGVASVNNPNPANVIGKDGETDNALRMRRQTSVSIPSLGTLDGLLGSILNLEGVNASVILENITNTVDSDNIPAHGIWVIVEGGLEQNIGNVIYMKKSAGVDMKGATAVNVTTASGTTYIVKYDKAITVPLHLKFTLDARTGLPSINQTFIKQKIAKDITYSINESADVADIIADIVPLVPDFYVENLKISRDGATWVGKIDTLSKQERFYIDTTKITITVV